MAIGNQATPATLNALLSAYSVQLRQLMDVIRVYNQFVGNLGTAGLEAIGYDSTDAAALVSAAAILNTVSALYYGTATQATAYDFDNALAPYWAGQ